MGGVENKSHMMNLKNKQQDNERHRCFIFHWGDEADITGMVNQLEGIGYLTVVLCPKSRELFKQQLLSEEKKIIPDQNKHLRCEEFVWTAHGYQNKYEAIGHLTALTEHKCRLAISNLIDSFPNPISEALALLGEKL